ncbi:hypothetical protein [Luteibacter sp. UNCMF366Tsu5.1]|uniref:hypothetical protein n=1 Tax=Luteibacter sp. UNCMF366Tsu5.1 TaxID=1502758 RepID=UPI000908B0E5|nr:hypothetical protein [Luteibacter sp. UNCMF366Tsu5.1]SFW75321.1 hypothetical protein SAMN02800691_3536 [Luteibacter sp. UNCMF366Tsu5.1]
MKPLSRPMFAAVAALFAVVMIGTRFHHFGDALHLPDASMALFFLGGIYLRKHLAFVAFVVLSVLVDWYSVSYAGVSDFCITVAYAFMPLAYAVLWYAGRLLAPRYDGSLRSHALVFAGLLVSATLSYAVSNGAFYWLGGRYAAPHMTEYVQRFVQWAPLFVRAAAGYVLVAQVIQALVFRFVPGQRGQRTAQA